MNGGRVDERSKYYKYKYQMREKQNTSPDCDYVILLTKRYKKYPLFSTFNMFNICLVSQSRSTDSSSSAYKVQLFFWNPCNFKLIKIIAQFFVKILFKI